HAEAAFAHAGIAARRTPLGPAEAFGADLALGLARRARRLVVAAGTRRARSGVELVAQRDRIDARLLRQLVDELLERERALRLPGRAERRRRPGVREHVVLLRARMLARVQRRADPADAAAGGDAARAPARLHDGGERAVLLGADLHRLHRRRTIADAQVLFLATEHEPHRR